MFIRSATTVDADALSLSTGFHLDDEPSRTKQSFKDECDINTIVRRFGVTGQVPVTSLEPQYGDFSGVNDYHSALNTLIATQAKFDAIPAHIRKHFDNDPAQFVEFVSNPENSAQLRDWGMLNPEIAFPPVAPLDVVLDAVEKSRSRKSAKDGTAE